MLTQQPVGHAAIIESAARPAPRPLPTLRIDPDAGPTLQDVMVEALHDLGLAINDVNRANGWEVCTPGDWDDPQRRYKIPAVLMLVVSEVAEALEAFRNDDRRNFIEELADVQIRLLDCVAGLRIDVPGEGGFAEAIFRKLEKNRHRGYRHGGKRV